ncbi:MAG: hypothetical protein JSV67_07380 [Thermoplasmatales archaeon]|nr:MAG: hypothetical protein JSV67_07380 [Thermoplasmatales archaeon]
MKYIYDHTSFGASSHPNKKEPSQFLPLWLVIIIMFLVFLIIAVVLYLNKKKKTRKTFKTINNIYWEI